MPAQKHRLEPQVRELVVNNPGWGPDRIRQLMEAAAEKAGIPLEDLPSSATIGRVRKNTTQADKALYEYVRWPETFEVGVLPWESAAALFEWRRNNGGQRPTVRRFRRFFQVTLARPDWSLDEQEEAALGLALADELGQPDLRRSVEDALAGLRDMGDVSVSLPATLWDSFIQQVREVAQRHPAKTLREIEHSEGGDDDAQA